MLLNGGELDGVRILSPATVRRMTTNALPPDIRFAGFATNFVGPQAGSTWGLGFAVRSNEAWSVVPGSVGSFSWMGVSGAYFWADPAAQLAVVQMVHVRGGSGPFLGMLRGLTYGALRIPDRGIPASADAPATIDAATLAACTGTYAFSSMSARDRQESASTSGFVGLGINLTTENGRIKVVSTVPGAPAAKAGIMASDIVTHLDDESLHGVSVSRAIEKMRGPVNTRVQLRIVRQGQDNPIEVPIVRAPGRLVGTTANLDVAGKDGKLQIEASGVLPVLDFEKGAPITVVPISNDQFVVDGGDHTRLAFLRDEVGKATGLVLNPGPWQITGQRIN